MFGCVDFDDLEFARGCFGFCVDRLFHDERMTPIEPFTINVMHEKHARGGRVKKAYVGFDKVKHATREVSRSKWFLGMALQGQLVRKSLLTRDLERVVYFNHATHSFVPGAGVEPAWPCGLNILSVVRLPISPPGLNGGLVKNLRDQDELVLKCQKQTTFDIPRMSWNRDDSLCDRMPHDDVAFGLSSHYKSEPLQGSDQLLGFQLRQAIRHN